LNIQDYISSGIIENHVLGLTSPAEDAELAKMSEQYPEVRQAIREAEEALVNYSLLHSKTPPSSAKEKIFNALTDEGEIRAVDEKQLMPDPARTYPFVRIIAIAASILFVATIAFHVVKVTEFRQRIRQLEQEKADLIVRNETFMAQIQDARRELEVIGDPAFRTIVLNGTPGHDEKRALVYWNTVSHEVYLKPANLPALPSDQQYQLWGIVGGQPVSAGIYDPGDAEHPLRQMDSFEKAEMFAITIEPAGGSEHPTLEQMVVAGKL